MGSNSEQIIPDAMFLNDSSEEANPLMGFEPCPICGDKISGTEDQEAEYHDNNQAILLSTFFMMYHAQSKLIKTDVCFKM